VQGDQRTDIEGKLTTLEEALKGTDTDAIKSATDEASQAFYKVAEEMYRQAEPPSSEGDGYEGGDGAPHDGDGHAGAHEGAQAGQEDVIDAEFRPS
jgi:molecular chaperone DnaK